MLAPHPSPPHPSVPARRKGAQPGNNNARKHGFYAARDPHPARLLLVNLRNMASSRVRNMPMASRPQESQDAVTPLLDLLGHTLSLSDDPRDPARDFYFENFLYTAGLIHKVRLRQEAPIRISRRMRLLARNAPWLMDYGFRRLGITEYPLFIPLEIEKLWRPTGQSPVRREPASSRHRKCLPLERQVFVPLDLPRNWHKNPSQPSAFPSLNWPGAQRGAHLGRVPAAQGGIKAPLRVPAPKGAGNGQVGPRGAGKGRVGPSGARRVAVPRLTASQWHLIEPLFRSLSTEATPGRRRTGRPRLTPHQLRPVFECLMFKLATGIRWRDLQGHMPVRRARLLLTRLNRSGRLAAIYNHLCRHLEREGSAPFETLAADSSVFRRRWGRVVLTTWKDLTWERYTTLFLLQRALRSLRTYVRHHGALR